MSRAPRVAIIGSGIIGLVSAWSLARAGCEVMTFDGNRESTEASWAAAGMLAPHNEAQRPDLLWDLCRESLSRWGGLAEALSAGGELDYHREGSWVPCFRWEERQALKAKVEAMASVGVDWTWSNSEELLTKEPGLSPQLLGAYAVEGGHVNPREVCHFLSKSCRDLGEFPEEMTEDDLAKAKAVALSEPLLRNRLINPEATVSAINITVELPGKALTEVPEVASFVRNLRDKTLAANPDINIYLSGMVMLNNAFAEAGQMDMGTLTPIMFLVILGLIAILTRSVVGTIGTLLVIILSTLGAMGIAGMMGVKLTPTSITATTVIMTLAVADCVHIVVSIMQGLRNGEAKPQAILHGIKSNLLPVFITSVTTAIGFLSLNFSDSPPYHDYGNITAIGVMLAFLLSVSFLPAFLALFPLKASKVVDPKSSTGIYGKLAEFVLQYQTGLRWGMVALVAVLATGVGRITLNDQFVEYFSNKVEFRRDTDAIMDKLTGIYNISFALETDLDGGVSNPQYMQKVEDFANYLRTESVVVHVNSLSDIYKRLNKNMHNDDEDFYKIPEDKELAAQYLLLYEMSLPYGLDLNSTVDIDKSSSKLIATLTNSSTVELRALEDRANNWIATNGQGVLRGNATSPSVMFSHISKRNIDSMISGTVISMVLITIIMILSLRSVRYGLISLIPNLVPLVMTFGLWGYAEGLVDMGVATIAGLTIGIVVDDTVHFMIKYLRAKRDQNRSSADAVRYAMGNVGPAIVMTSIVLVAGFGVMSTSTFRMNYTMGIMSAATIAFALIVDVFLLPPILTIVDRKGSTKTAEIPTTQPATGV